MKLTSPIFGAVALLAVSANGNTCPPPFNRPQGLNTTAQTILAESLGRLRLHALNGPSAPLLDQAEILSATNDFIATSHQLTATHELLESALDFVDEFETLGYGPYCMDDSACVFSRIQGTEDGREFDRSAMIVMQAIMDEAYHASVWGDEETGKRNFGSQIIDWTYKPIVKECQDLFRGRKWLAAAYTPGMVDPPADPTIVHNIMVDASYKPLWGRPTAWANLKRAIRPLGGLYLAPGEIAQITVPPELVGKGYHIAIGSQMVDCSRKDEYQRVDRITNSVPIDEEVMYAANPFGGELYLRSPYGSVAGQVQVNVTGGIVQSASFFWTSVKHTTEEEWNYLRANTNTPFVSIETDPYLLSWTAYDVKEMTYAFMVERVQRYEQVYNEIAKYQGVAPDKRNTYVLFEGVRNGGCSRSAVAGIGYPQANDPFVAGPNGPEPWRNGFADRDPLRGWDCCGREPLPFEQDPTGRHMIDRVTSFHELGHTAGYKYSQYRAEGEATTQLALTMARSLVDGADLDTSLMFSLSTRVPKTFGPRFTLDNCAVDWMLRDNFIYNGADMDGEEIRYQHRGHAKYVEMAKLTGGWQYMEQFYKEEHQRWEDEGLGAKADYWWRVGNKTSFFPELHPNNDRYDERTLRFSIIAGQDLTPLIHFWGAPPDNYPLLKELMAARGLYPSQEVKDMIMRYMSLVPYSKEDYDDFIEGLWVPSISGECNQGCFFHQERAGSWNQTSYAAVQDAAYNILATYWPNTTKSPSISPTTATPSISPTTANPSASPTTTSPTISPTPRPTNLKYYTVCGRSTQPCSGVAEAADAAEQHPVRCCSESDLGDGWSMRPECAASLGRNVWGASEINGVCYPAETHADAEAVCASAGARLCAKEELLADCTARTGCSLDFRLNWSSTLEGTTYSPTLAPTTASPTLAPTTSPTPRPTNLKYYTVCGRSTQPCSGVAQATDATEQHPVRCCSDSDLGDGWTMRSECAASLGRNVWGASEINGVCYPAETHASAADLCASAGARLCTMKELLADCTGRTGCQLDYELNWSSTREGTTYSPTLAPTTASPTISPTPRPTSLKYYLVCGRSTQPCSGVAEAVEATEQHPVRCCSDTDLGDGWSMRSECAASLGRNVWGESEINGVCYPAETHADAMALCASAGARLCTKEELLADCTGRTGCSLDYELNWSSTLAGSDEAISRQRSLDSFPSYLRGKSLDSSRKDDKNEHDNGKRNLGDTSLEVALNKWITLGGRQYSFTLELIRPLIDDVEANKRGPFRVRVVDGAILNAVDSETGESVETTDLVSIEGLFDFISASIDEGNIVNVRYDAEFGFPVETNVMSADPDDEDDFNEEADEEYIYIYVKEVDIGESSA